jgi:16S rRNA (uracil1498-N3)-methyltransferase
VELDERAAHHGAVKRLAIGDTVRLTSGDGRRARGTIAHLGKRRFAVDLDGPVEEVVMPSRVELWAPVGDRERMLLLAEKAVELGASVWRPVIYARSRSVSPRGEGESFREKLKLRQINALEQCGSAWLPEALAEVALYDALANAGSEVHSRLLLDGDGESLSATIPALDTPVQIALGPEGGLEEEERATFIRAGWRPVSLGANVLRFETAGMAALAIVRSHLQGIP